MHDYFDGVIQCAKWLAYLGDNRYEFTLGLNRHLNHWRARLGLPCWSLSAYLKPKVKMYCNNCEWVESRTELVEHHDGRLELLCCASGHEASEQGAKARALAA